MSTLEVPVAPPEQPAAPTAAPGGSYAGLRLPDFWSDAPAGWFLYAESRFRIRNITSEVDRFDHLVGALPKSSVRLVLDALESPDADRPYSTLKQRLLASHELLEFQRIELLFKMEPLGSRKPSELLSHMLEICPKGRGKEPLLHFSLPTAATQGALQPPQRLRAGPGQVGRRGGSQVGAPQS
jgi:hypothetical protein